MPIKRGMVVRLDYELKDCDGELLEDEGAQLEYLHGGYDGIFPKVEEALEGQDVGHELALTLEPEDAFGDYDAQLLRVEPRASFPEALEVGMRFEGVPGDDEEEALIYTVTDITAESVVVDGNHPLAGERLWFKGKVSAVRPATAEELQHGHPHGDLGAHAA
ncbi:MAG TPA: peptidylprolyl isomerase [Usitatibacter sp.]|nr:peptidylprolyl isomerase [Usitatibacter sp.]